MTPSFIGIGAQKCATTWLYDLLELHPAVELSSEKEIHFFSQFYEYGFQWYESHYNSSTEASVIGEFSTSYFSDLDAPIRIKKSYPDIKLILMLRDPIERLVSNHKHEVRIGHFTGPDFSVEAGIKNNPSYIEQSQYASHLKRWFKHFDKEQIHIVLFDDVKSQPNTVEQELYAFLDIGQKSNHTLLGKSNSSYVYRFGLIEKIRKLTITILKNLNLENLYRKIVKQSGLQTAYRKINRANSDNVVPPMQDETLVMLKKLFEPELLELETMTGLDLGKWK